MRWVGCLVFSLLGLAALAGGVVGIFIGHAGAFPAPILAVMLILVVGTVAAGGMRRMARPMDRLIEAATRIEAQDYSARVPEWGPSDLRSVARAFNSMAERLKAIDDRRRSFLADVTHELRTPLAVIRGQAEAIADGVYPADAAHLAPILDATEALDRLVEDLRTMALSDADSLVLKKEPTNLGSLIEDVVDSLAAQAESAGVKLTAESAPDGLVVALDPSRIRGAVGNLVSNAIRHTPNGGSVSLAVASLGDRATITVTDTGEGIPPNLLPRVFDRFVKGPGSPGSGLGLAIAHDIVVAHGGTIRVENAATGGVVATIELPLQPPP